MRKYFFEFCFSVHKLSIAYDFLSIYTDPTCSQFLRSYNHMALYKYRISENSTEARESRDQLPLPKDFDFGAALQC